MGLAMVWIAVRGKPAEQVLARFGLRRTGTALDHLDREHPIAWTELDGGWVLVAVEVCASLKAEVDGRRVPCCQDERGRADAFLASLSAGADVVTVYVEEHVMCSLAEGWRDGVRAWRVDHDSEEGPDHLEVDGVPPVDPPATARALVADYERRWGRPPRAGDSDQPRSGLLGKVLDFLQVPRGGPPDEEPDVDVVFDVPLEVAKAVTGFRYDSFEGSMERLDPA